jgi:hypothetical protein
MHTLASVLLASVLTLSIVGLTTTNMTTAQPFDITTEQGDKEALITVKLATNNTVVIPPNGTVIEVPGNITQIDNDTVIITPDNETVTPLPGNVTVITPPEPQPCGCPVAGNETSEEPSEEGIPPVTVQPAPGQEVITENGTELVSNESQEEPLPPVPEPEPAPAPAEGNETGGDGPIVIEPAQNETGGDSGSNETGTTGGNDTGLVPASLNLGWLKL